ncbi:rCG21696 [Rattus norvegicus]|uniref:RCG21696 n=1 Tax=Rattus norvegicus TaxID=10116 RepID=A6J075_RAT|nr:rCG21696 [Rattus norvegicus]
MAGAVAEVAASSPAAGAARFGTGAGASARPSGGGLDRPASSPSSCPGVPEDSGCAFAFSAGCVASSRSAGAAVTSAGPP